MPLSLAVPGRFVAGPPLIANVNAPVPPPDPPEAIPLGAKLLTVIVTAADSVVADTTAKRNAVMGVFMWFTDVWRKLGELRISFNEECFK